MKSYKDPELRAAEEVAFRRFLSSWIVNDMEYSQGELFGSGGTLFTYAVRNDDDSDDDITMI